MRYLRKIKGRVSKKKEKDFQMGKLVSKILQFKLKMASTS